jgi:glycosyltransferase involved in cell wall biosynthesis
MVIDMLRANGVNCAVEEAVDNNCIDRLVTKHQPSTVIIEALWVVPEKFEILHKLHPTVRWIVRLHSEVPFIANEGMAMGWLRQHSTQAPYVTIAANSTRMCRTLGKLLGTRISYLPNYYTRDNILSTRSSPDNVINISCFGAIRPLKNHLTQAVAAIQFANLLHVPLRFHINGSRVEGNGGAILKNLRELFPTGGRHTLIEHGWYSHDEFKQVIRDQIDVGMQVSFTESYNIVAADHIDCGIPVVTSPEITFVAWPYTADPTDPDDMVGALQRSICAPWLAMHRINNIKLDNANRRATEAWISFAQFNATNR